MADQSKNNTPEIFELNNGSMHVKISNYGATITSLFVPDKNGSFSIVSIFIRFICFPFLHIRINHLMVEFDFLNNWKGKSADVVLGFDSVDPYAVNLPNFFF